MSKMKSKFLAAAVVACALAVPAAAQLPPPPPPLPDEIRPRIVVVAPPALRVETVVARPAPGYVWARGYWDWDGDSWAWVRGQWAMAPVRSATWVPASYRRVSSGWDYVPGHWSSQRVVRASKASRGKALGHVKAKGKGHQKGKGNGHEKYD